MTEFSYYDIKKKKLDLFIFFFGINQELNFISRENYFVMFLIEFVTLSTNEYSW